MSAPFVEKRCWMVLSLLGMSLVPLLSPTSSVLLSPSSTCCFNAYLFLLLVC